jgi:hypothetical protein
MDKHNYNASPVEDIGLVQEKFDLHNAPEVKLITTFIQAKGEHLTNVPEATVGHYLGELSARHSLFNKNVVNAQVRRNNQAKAHIIQPEQVTDSYFENLKKIAREQGHGDILTTEYERERQIRVIQADQFHSFKRWADYLSSDDAPFPTWFKYFTYRGMSKLGAYDGEKKSFRARNPSTVAPYPELNREALALVFHLISQRDSSDLNELEQGLAKSGNFNKLYSHALELLNRNHVEQSGTTEGEWIKYDQTEDEDPNAAAQLSESLTGFNTGWCTASPETAALQLEGGDFYVYYSYDMDGKPTIPRIAIRTNNGVVGEVRGIGPNQDMEPVMFEIVGEKLNEIPGGDVYEKAIADMKRLTELDNRLIKDPQADLSLSDLKFLYQIDKQDLCRIFNTDILTDTHAQILLDTYEPFVEEWIISNISIFSSISGTTLTRLINQAREKAIEHGYDMDFDTSNLMIKVNRADLLHAIESPYNKELIAELISSEYDALHLIKGVDSLRIPMNNSLTPQDISILCNQLAEQLSTWDLADNLGKLRFLRAEIAIKLLNAGEEEAVRNNLSSFRKQAGSAIREWYAESGRVASEDLI